MDQAAVAAGVSMSYVELSGRALATTRVRRAVVWDTVQIALPELLRQLPVLCRAVQIGSGQDDLPGAASG